MTQDELNKIKELHLKWLNDEEDGERADLCGANLRWIAAGNKKEIITHQTKKYQITYTAEVMSIGCKQFLLSEWWEFDDDRIARMDDGALEWWKTHKPLLQALIEANPATPHGGMKAANENA